MGKEKRTEASRQERKAKKRAAEDAVPDLPGDINEPEDVEIEKSEKKSGKRKRDGEEGEGEVKKSKKEKKRKVEEEQEEGDAIEGVEEGEVVKKSKKEKKAKKEAEVEEDIQTQPTNGEVEASKKSKKERKAERRVAELAAAAKEPKASTNGDSKPKPTEDTADSSEEKKASKKNNRNREKKRKGVTEPSNPNKTPSSSDPATAPKSTKPARFIVFVGNLPFTANTASITSHFAKVKPMSVRCLTKKEEPSKCKGCAFVEFEGYDSMKTCLKIMHHSVFDDKLSAARKINVELTAGGGGNTKDRKDKIASKNVKLNEERIRKIHEEEKAKATKAMENGAKSGAASIDESAVHPSRRRMVPGAV